MGFLPAGTVYDDLLNRDTSDLVQNVNINYLTGGGIQAWQLFWQDVIKGLRARKAPLDDVLAYDIRNEMAFVADAPPFSLASGRLQLRTVRRTTSPTRRARAGSWTTVSSTT